MSIEIKELSHIYSEGSPFESRALDKISGVIEKGSFTGLIGHTGSGKSTFIQHLNVLLKPTSGQIIIDGVDINDKDVNPKSVREKVGLVFQYPEHQLFEETVEKDVAYGPGNLGLDENEIADRVKNALELVGLDYEKVKDKSPFELSGGQMRRVAIAGVLAMKPRILILDEPTAGLDPRGRDDILKVIKSLHENERITVILVSHSMEDIAKFVDKIMVMYRGKIEIYDVPEKVFSQAELLEKIGLAVPQVTYLMRELKKIDPKVNQNVYTVDQAQEEIVKMIRRKDNA
ncbi:energy-coupling factor transporter ATPase [Alkalibacter mobilis]|uniref:energy-coupling factor transporter ATPase n=1 Tax=Alkalibacter mobilis TaxID=2787712 RepID=UPI00189D2FA0|nr:energy-coupling factor transporter ATPase [Alkalibacter mobilis]MBF7095960.1 energy-coupling factor transporter ATPase [Alkalibacter mobilis]